MESKHKNDTLTPALEDYLETLWEILQSKKVAQVSDIAEKRGVNVASVTPAMRRLMKMGLVDYTARAWVDLTPKGIQVARKIKTRHDLIKRFLMEVLGVSEENATKDACSAEHMFSDETIDRLVRFFEYTQRCDATEMAFLKRFLTCSIVHPESKNDEMCNCTQQEKQSKRASLPLTQHLSSLSTGDAATILQIVSNRDLRTKLINKGFVSGRKIKVISIESGNTSFKIQIDSDIVVLNKQEAEDVLVIRQ